MKILQVYKTTYPISFGGIEQVIHQLALGMNDKSNSCNVLALEKFSTSKVINQDNYKIFIEPLNYDFFSNSISFSLLNRFKSLIKDVDIVHYHFPWPFLDLIHFLSAHKKPTVLTYHSDIIRQKKLFALYKPLMNRFLKDVDVIVTTSPNYLNSSTILQKYSYKTKVIPIGIDKKTYAIRNKNLLESFTSQFGDKFFLFVGVLRYYKGLHILIESLKDKDYPLVIVGDGPEMVSLTILIDKYNLKKVFFLGKVSDEERNVLYKKCLAVILPSHLRSEAFGVTLIEGLLYGKCLISTEISTGTSFINIHKKTGLVVQPNNPYELAKALEYVWCNPKQVLFFEKNSKKRFLSFTAKKMVNSYNNIYQDIFNI